MTDFYKGDTFRSSVDGTWTTPKDFFKKLDDEFHFTLDAAALKESALVSNYFGPDHEDVSKRDALAMDWVKESNGGWIWFNPPYGRGIGDFMAKAKAEVEKGAKVVALVPARTDTNWWWNSAIMYEVRFVKGRLKFGDGKNSAPFPSAVVVMQ